MTSGMSPTFSARRGANCEGVVALSRPCHVWIVNHYADAPDRPSGTRHYDLARQLLDRGFEVTVVAAAFNHLTGRDERLRGRRMLRFEEFEGVRFAWLRTFPYRGNTWRRQLNMLSFLLVFLVAQARISRPDVVIGSTVHPFAALGAWLVARMRGARFIFEVRDLWPQTLVDLGAMSVGSPGERLLRAIESFLVRRASAVITLLPGMRLYLAERGLPLEHVTYLPNGVDIATADLLRASPISREAGSSEAAVETLQAITNLRSEGRFVVGYIGSFGRVNALNTVVEAMRLADQASPGTIGLVMIGDGPERPALVRQAADIAGLHLGGPVPKHEVQAMLATLDAGLIHATETPVYRYGISFNKLFDYMAASLPIVFACTSEQDPVRLAEAGISLAPDDPVALATSLLALAALDAETIAEMGAAGRRYVVREHDMKGHGGALAALVDCGTPS